MDKVARRGTVMASTYQVELHELPAYVRTELAVGLMRNYAGIDALVTGGMLTVSSTRHDERFLELACLAERAAMRAQEGSQALRSELYDYLLG